MHYTRLLTAYTSAALCFLAPLTVSAQSDKKEQKDEVEEIIRNIKDSDFKREIKALEEAANLLAEVNDEASAKKAVQKLTQVFNRLPVPVKGNEEILKTWARSQNRVSFQMWRLKDEPYFEKLKMQALWSLITDPFSRPTAEK